MCNPLDAGDMATNPVPAREWSEMYPDPYDKDNPIPVMQPLVEGRYRRMLYRLSIYDQLVCMYILAVMDYRSIVEDEASTMYEIHMAKFRATIAYSQMLMWELTHNEH